MKDSELAPFAARRTPAVRENIFREGFFPHATFHLPPTGLAMKTYVLDASALITFFDDRSGADKVEELLAKAAEAKHPLAIWVVNWGEVYYSIWRARGEKAARAKLYEIAQLPVVGVAMELACFAGEPMASAVPPSTTYDLPPTLSACRLLSAVYCLPSTAY